jgi:hypothetical protein
MHDLLADEVDRLRDYLAGRPRLVPAFDGQTMQDAHDDLCARCDTLLHPCWPTAYTSTETDGTPLNGSASSNSS